MTIELENERRRMLAAAERRDADVEKKERSDEEIEKKMAAKERAEKMVRESKSTKKMIQNIMANMQQVMKAVQVLRQQLQIQQNDDDIPSIKMDQATINGLKRKFLDLQSQIKDLRGALVNEEVNILRSELTGLSEEEIYAKAEQKVETIMKEFEILN